MINVAHSLTEQRSSMYGRVTKTRGGRIIEINLPLFGLWRDLATLFPSALLNPTIGSRLFGTSDLPMVILAKNGDKLTIANVRMVGLANLELAANKPCFAAAAKFIGLIANNAAPTDANAYYTFQTGQTYAEGDFALTAFKSKTWTGVWAARTGFTSIQTEAGWKVDWEIGTTPDPVDGIGAVDMFLDTFWGKATAIPVGPTWAQIEANQHFQGDAGSAVGAGIDGDTDDLVLGDGTSSLTLKACALTETGLVFAPSKKRIGPTMWEPTRGFSAGTPAAIAAAA